MTFKNYERYFTEIDRPTWDEYFLKMVDVVKLRSCDGNTKVGSILVDSKHRIIGTGYNSFPAGVDDSSIPNFRPEGESDSPKYLRMIHAELNAICNRIRYHDDKLTAYINIPPCQGCLNALCQNNVKRIVVKDHTYKVCKDAQAQYEYDDTLLQSHVSLESLTMKYQQNMLGQFIWAEK